MSAAHNLPPRKRCRGNLRPAPFFLNEATVRGVIELQFGKRMAGVPVVDIELVDRPRAATAPYPFRDHRALAEQPGCEPAPEPNPLHEPASDAPESPDFPDAPLPDSFPEPEWIGLDMAPAPEPVEVKHEEAVCQSAQAEPEPFIAPDNRIGQALPDDRPVMLPIPSRPLLATRAERIARQRLDAEARELEAPVDVCLHRGERPRIELIRAAAEALRDLPAPARPAEPRREARPLPGPRAPRAATLPPLPFEQRRRQIDGAIRFLAARGVLVTPVDRMAAIRTYRVSGKRDPKLAEEVIEIAVERGFALEGDRK